MTLLYIVSQHRLEFTGHQLKCNIILLHKIETVFNFTLQSRFSFFTISVYITVYIPVCVPFKINSGLGRRVRLTQVQVGPTPVVSMLWLVIVGIATRLHVK